MQYTERFFIYRSKVLILLVVCMVVGITGCLPDYNVKITRGVQPDIEDNHLASADGHLVRTTQVGRGSKSFGLLVLSEGLGSVVGVRDDEDVIIQRLDTLLQPLWEKKMVLGDEDHDNILDFFHHDSQVVIVESRQTGDSIRYLATAYDVRSGDPAWNAVLATVPKHAFEDENLQYATIISPDSSSFLLYGRKTLDYGDMRHFRTLRMIRDGVLLNTVFFSASGKEIARRQFIVKTDSSRHLWNEHLVLDDDANLYIVNTRGRQTMEAERHNLRTGAQQRLAVQIPGLNMFHDDSASFQSKAYLEPGGRLSVRGIRTNTKRSARTSIPYIPIGPDVHGLLHVRFDFDKMAADIPVDFTPDDSLVERLFDIPRFALLEYRDWIPFSNGNGGCFALEWGGWIYQEDMVSQHYALLAFDDDGKALWQATVPKSQEVYFEEGSRSKRTFASDTRWDRPVPNLLSLSNQELSILNIAATALPTPEYIEIFYVDLSNDGVVRWRIRQSDGLATGPERIAWVPGKVALAETGIRRVSPNTMLMLTYYKSRFDLNLVRVFPGM